MTPSVAVHCEDAIVPGSREFDIPNPSTEPNTSLKTRIRALVGFWENLTIQCDIKPGSHPAKFSHTARPSFGKLHTSVRDLYRPCTFGTPLGSDCPPSYEDCVYDLPPDYTETEALASANRHHIAELPCAHELHPKPGVTDRSTRPCTDYLDLDFSALDNIRTRGKKKKKGAQANNRWADSDNEEKKEGGDGLEGDGNGGDGGNAGSGSGGGADPPGGNDGDDGDDWWNTGASGNKKDKKKKKKNAWDLLDDDEEEKKKKEEEEEEAKKAEEAATGAADGEGGADPLDDWGSFAVVGKKKKKKGKAELDPLPEPEVPAADDAPVTADIGGGDDGWSNVMTTGKKKKGKKGKDLDPEPEPGKAPEPDPIMDPIDLDASATGDGALDDWGGFATAGKKKKKNGLKGKDEAAPEADKLPPPPDPEPAADDGDDWMSFGKKGKKDKKKSKTDSAPEPPKDTTNEMRFDDINLLDDKSAPKLDLDFGSKKNEPAENKGNGFSFSGWGSGWGSSSWGFGNGSDVPAEPKTEDSTWAFTSSMKKDKDKDKDKNNKKSSGGFDFSFDNLAGDAGNDALGLDIGTAKDEPKLDDDPWGSFGKKDKKSKKKNMPDPAPVVEAPPPVEDKPAADDPWGGFNVQKGKKTKKKTGSIWDPEPEADVAAVVVPDPEPIKEEEEDPWSTSFGMSAKDKKKAAKKAAKGGKDEVQAPAEPDPIAQHDPLPAATTQEDSFDSWGFTTKKTKKGKKSDPEPVQEIPPPPAEAKAIADDPWASFGVKDKKKKKGGFGFDWADEPTDPVVDVATTTKTANPEPSSDLLGDGWGDVTSKKTKKGKKGAFEDIPPAPALIEPAKEAAPEDDWFGAWGSAGKKDKKKTGKNDLIEALPQADNTFLTPEAVVEPKADGDDDWGNTWSVGTKKKASKKDKSKGIVEVSDPSPGASILLPESVQEKSAEEDTWGGWTTGKKAKSKTSKKGTTDPSPPPPPELGDDIANVSGGNDLLDMVETPVDDPWSFSTSTKKKSSKTEKKNSKTVEPPKVEDSKLTKTKSKDSKTATDDFLDIAEQTPDTLLDTEVSKKEKKEDKKASSAWGGIWGGTTAKKETSKERKEREKKEQEERDAAAKADEAQRKAEEEAFAAALGDDPNDILNFDDDPPAPPTKKSSSKDKELKDSKKKASDKSTKVESKSSKKTAAKEEPAVVVEVPEVVEPDPILELDEPKQADGWSFWGASLKSSKKTAPATTTTTAKGNKTGLDPWANQSTPLSGKSNMPDISFDEDLMESATSPLKSSAAATTSKSKSTVKSSSIQDRIKALKVENTLDSKSSKSKKGASVPPPEPEDQPEPEPEIVVEPEPVPVSDKKSKKAAATTKSSKKDKKEALPPVEQAPPHSVSPVPGGFPIDDLLYDEPEPERDMATSPPKKSSKDKKSASKTTKKETKTKSEPVQPPAATFDLLGGDETDAAGAGKLPTPPPEDDDTKAKKSGKKERPKVVRDQASTSWGFWGATPAKKPVKKSKDKDSKDDGAVSPTTKDRPSGLSRSKSARKASDRDPLEKASRSSGSENDGKKDSRSRPSTSRGMSFSMFGMGAIPSRSKSTRISATPAKGSSRRHSTAVEDTGLASPPPEEKDIPPKAAKIIGVSRTKSSRAKAERRSVDPYGLDSEDYLMADRPEDSAKDIEEPKKRSSKSRRQSSYMSGGLGAAEDAEMVDAARPSDDAKVTSGPDDLAFGERPTPARRNTATNKKAGLMGGLFGAFSSRPTPERRTSKAYESEDNATRRKRASGYDDDNTKRLRREDRTINRSRKTSAADGLTDFEDAEAKEARRRERRERREKEVADEEARVARRRARAREEEQRQAREEEEREARYREERRARRAEKEARRAEEDRVAREEEKVREERRERRRERERQRAEEEAVAAAAAAAKSKTDRRRSYADTPDEEEARRLRREERRMRRSVDQGAGVDRPRTSRRRSEYPAPVDGEPLPPPKGTFSPINAIKTGGDKTASWVHSINEEPPPPPPVEGTIVDAPIHFAEDNTPDPLGETTAREFRSRRRREREDEESESRRRRRRETDEIIRSSDGSSKDRRRKSYAAPAGADFYDDMGSRAFDGRPAMAPKRGSSWLKKIAGL